MKTKQIEIAKKALGGHCAAVEKLLTFMSSSPLKNLITPLIAGVIALFFAAAASAAETTVFVDGRSGPWDIAANPTFRYGDSTDIHLPPTSVSSASGLSFAAGNTLTIEYASGLANAGG